MFFCTFAIQTNVDLAEYTFYGLMCDDMMFMQTRVNQKLRCLLDYFESFLSVPLSGVLTISRNCLCEEAIAADAWTNCGFVMKDLTVRQSGGIEDAKVGLLIDFANEYVGGGIGEIAATVDYESRLPRKMLARTDLPPPFVK